MAIRDLLEQYKLFQFDREAHEEIDRHFVRPLEEERVAAELANVSAAEVAALRWLGETLGWIAEREPQKPIRVTRLDAQFALAKASCTPFYGCKRRTGEATQLWDVVLFAGDMAKLESISIHDVTALSEDPNAVAVELERRYRESGVEWAERIVQTDYIRLEVFLWITKLALIRNPDQAEDDVAGYARSLGISEPEAMGV